MHYQSLPHILIRDIEVTVFPSFPGTTTTRFHSFLGLDAEVVDKIKRDNKI